MLCFSWGCRAGAGIYWADLSALTTRFDTAARWITVVLNPAVVAVLAFLFLTGLPAEGAWRWIAWAVVLGPGIPSVYAVVIYTLGKAPSVFLPDARQRVVPLVLAAVSCFVATWQLVDLSAPAFAVLLMTTYGCIALASALVSRWWGISLHAAGVCGPWVVGCLAVGYGYVWAFPVPIVIGWARIRDRGHSLDQVIVGTLVGGASAVTARWILGQWGVIV